MALAFTHLTTLVDDANTTGYATGSITPTAGATLVVGPLGAVSATPPTPTITSAAGWGLTWTAIKSSAFDTAGTQRTLFTFYSSVVPSSPGAGVITATYGSTMSGAGISVVQVTGQDTSTPIRAVGGTTGAPKESHSTGTSQSTTLDTFADPANACLAFVASDESVTFAGANGFTILGQATSPGGAPVQAIASLWKANAVNPATTSTGTAGQTWGMVAMEVRAAPSSTGFPSVNVYLGLGSNPLSAAVTWTLISSSTDPDTRGRFVSLSYTSSGRSLDLEDFEGGSGSIVLRNNDGRFTPGNAASPYYPNIKLRMPIRVVATRGTDVLTIRGYVDATPVKPDPPNRAMCEWPIVDAFTLMNERAAEYPWQTAIRQQVPKLWLNFNELSGTTVVDDSGNGYLGTYVGGPTLQVAYGTGTGVTFNGTTQYASIVPGAGITGGGDFALEMFLAPSPTATGVVYSQWDNATGVTGLSVEVTGVGLMRVIIGDAVSFTTVNGTSNRLGADTHMIFRRQGTTHEMIVNGVVESTGTDTVRTISSPTHIYVAASSTPSPGNFLAATIDALATYQGTMTSTQAALHYQAFLAFHALFAGQQVGYILDAYGWPTADRTLDTGNSQVLGQFVPNGSVLDMVRLAARSDFGAVYMTLDGKVRFRQRQAIMLAPYTTSQATFGNAGASLPAIISALQFDYDSARVKNDVTLKVDWQTGAIVTTPYAVTIRKTDPTSIDTYGDRSYAPEVLTMAPGGTAATAIVLNDLADYTLGRYKEPLREIRELTIQPIESSATALWTQVLTRAQEDRITHTHLLPGGETISGEYHIQRIRHDIGPGKTWRTVWTISPADTQSYWILETSALDVGTRLGA
jgi:hypothetical protein